MDRVQKSKLSLYKKAMEVRGPCRASQGALETRWAAGLQWAPRPRSSEGEPSRAFSDAHSPCSMRAMFATTALVDQEGALGVLREGRGRSPTLAMSGFTVGWGPQVGRREGSPKSLLRDHTPKRLH